MIQGRTVSEREKLIGMSGLTIVLVFFLSSVGSVLFMGLGLGLLGASVFFSQALSVSRALCVEIKLNYRTNKERTNLETERTVPVDICPELESSHPGKRGQISKPKSAIYPHFVVWYIRNCQGNLLQGCTKFPARDIR